MSKKSEDDRSHSGQVQERVGLYSWIYETPSRGKHGYQVRRESRGGKSRNGTLLQVVLVSGLNNIFGDFLQLRLRSEAFILSYVV